MLPFMKPRPQGAVIIAARKPDGSHSPEKEEGGVNPALMAIAEDLISAVHAKDATGVAHALDAAAQICGEDYGDEAQSPMEGME